MTLRRPSQRAVFNRTSTGDVSATRSKGRAGSRPLSSRILATLHETGHAIYEQGVNAAYVHTHTHINLPGGSNGLQLAALVRSRWPAINIIVVTGYSTPRSEEIPSGSLFVPKPYSARKMIEAVRYFQH